VMIAKDALSERNEECWPLANCKARARGRSPGCAVHQTISLNSRSMPV
jgi:hypothetical protein